MEWLIALGALVAGMGLVVLAVSTKKSSRPRGAAGAFVTGLAEALDPAAAQIALENEKRLAMEGEEDNGAPPSGGD